MFLLTISFILLPFFFVRQSILHFSKIISILYLESHNKLFWGIVNIKKAGTGILWGPGVGLTSSLGSGQNPTEGTKQKQTGCWTGPVLSIHHITPTANNTTALRSGPHHGCNHTAEPHIFEVRGIFCPTISQHAHVAKSIRH